MLWTQLQGIPIENHTKPTPKIQNQKGINNLCYYTLARCMRGSSIAGWGSSPGAWRQEAALAHGRGQQGHSPCSPGAHTPGPPSPLPPPPWPRAPSCFSALPCCEYGCLPYAKHLRSQLTVAINTHGALSRGQHYHTAELQIPNLGSKAPRRSAH